MFRFRRTSSSTSKRRKPGEFRSKFERTTAENLKARGIEAVYEPHRLDYTVKRKYLPDFVLKNGTVVEVKGYFPTEDRSKIKAVIEANPGTRICMLLQRASNTISKQSATTYAQWCEKNNIPWAEGTIPDEWTR